MSFLLHLASRIARLLKPYVLKRTEALRDDDVAGAESELPREKREWWDFLKRATTRGPHDLRATLRVDETGYRRVAGYSHADARAYFLYNVLDEVQKAGVAIIQWVDFLGPDNRDRDRPNQLDRVILQSASEDQSFRIRKLVETLINLICFELTNENDYYRHFLLLTDLDHYLSMQQDLIDFYACPSRNIEETIQMTCDWISRLETSSVATARCWYLRERQPLVRAQVRAGRIFSSVRSRLMEALSLANAEEKLALGQSYHLFSETSRDIHFTPSAPRFDLSVESVIGSIDQCGLLCMPILLRCQRLLGVVPPGINEPIRRSYDTNEYPRQLLSRVTQGRAEVGDFVLAYGDLAEVLEVGRSAFDYEAYRVRYLAERPLPSVDEDWFPARYVQRLYTRAAWLQGVDDLVAQGKLPPDTATRLRALSADLQAEALRKALVDVWKLYLRDAIREKRRRRGT